MKTSFKAHVLAKQNVSPSLLRIRLGGGDLHEFTSTGYADEWIRLVFPNALGTIALPERGMRKHGMPDDAVKSPTRPYSIRKWDQPRSQMTIEFALHDHGLATDWARAADIGDEIGIASPDGRYCVPSDAVWILILCDLTGLPAASRIVEEERAGRAIYLHAELPGAEDVPQGIFGQVSSAHWHSLPNDDLRPTALEEIARSIILPEGSGYIWIAGEAQAIYASREHFRDVQGFDKDRITAIGYWFRDRSRS